MLECTSDLTDIFYNSLLGKADILLHRFLDDKLQVSLLCPFYGDKEFVELVVYEPVEVLYYIWMVQALRKRTNVSDRLTTD